jgi:hypothetical protein
MIESVPASTGAVVPSLPPSRVAVGEGEEPHAAIASASRYALGSVTGRVRIEESLRYPIGRCDGKVAWTAAAVSRNDRAPAEREFSYWD